MTIAPAGGARLADRRLTGTRPAWLALVMLFPLLASCGGREVAAPGGTGIAGTGAGLAMLTIGAAGGASATVTVELATTERERELGLMYRDSLPEARGMLFVFASDQRGGFWMKNTGIPLTIAYLDTSGRVLELRNGQPFDETSLLPSQPYRYALEVNQGWFGRHGLGVGATVELPAHLPAAE